MRPLLVLLSISVVTSCGTLPTREEGGAEDLRELGLALAQAFDEPNGEPVDVWSHYRCIRGHTCVELNAVQVSPISAEAFVTAFARALRIPVVVPSGPRVGPKCDWSGADEGTGLGLRFDPPDIVGDSARVVSMAWCDATPRRQGGFFQSHEYIFRRADPGWYLVLRRLRAIS